MTTTPEREMLRIMTFGAYDLQMLRMQTGLRLTANFRNKLKREGAEEVEAEEDELLKAAGVEEGGELLEEDKEELSAAAKKLIDQLKDSYKRLTDGVARNRSLPAEKGFTGDALISSFTELVLVDQYIKIETNEKSQFRQMESALSAIPIYSEYLKDVSGIGPAMSSVLISYFDPHKAPRISNFWSYCGLDVAPDGRGRSRRAEHLIDREYIKADGTKATRKSVTYNPWLKSRLLGALAPSFIRTKNCPWKKVYEEYKHRLQTDPNRLKLNSINYKIAYKKIMAGVPYRMGDTHEDVTDITKLWPPLRIHRAAMRYMVKMFLIEFWVKWRELEGLEVTPTYHEAKQGYRHVA
jgi:hypothetical protein